MSKLLSGNNKPILDEVKQYWLGMCLHLFQLLTTHTNEDRVSNEVRAVTLARLAGIGLAMHQFFGGAVEKLGFADNRGVQEAGARTYGVATKHMQRLEEKYSKSLS